MKLRFEFEIEGNEKLDDLFKKLMNERGLSKPKFIGNLFNCLDISVEHDIKNMDVSVNRIYDHHECGNKIEFPKNKKSFWDFFKK